MMQHNDQNTPIKELQLRWKRYRHFLNHYLPEADGAFIFSRINIFYFTGTFASGVLWLPKEGEPVLFCRRGVLRAKLETPLEHIFPFNSYGDIGQLFTDIGVALPGQVATEMNSLPWSLAQSLTRHMPEVKFVSGDRLIALTRARKSEWELQILRRVGEKHNTCLTKLLPAYLHKGITELEISHRISELFYAEGHHGILRMDAFGEEVFLGHIAIGNNANYPSVFNGPVGLRGVHPAVPFMGAEDIRWNDHMPLIIDNGFNLAGYQTDKTQVYWLGHNNSIPKSLQKAHDFCVDMQSLVAKQLRPGAIPSKIWAQCLELAAKSPWNDGFMGLGGNKVSFVGHGIGLAIDEYPVLAKGFDLPLEEGMVLAVEPKVGVADIGMAGTENTFEVTSAGGVSLTGHHDDIITV